MEELYQQILETMKNDSVSLRKNKILNIFFQQPLRWYEDQVEYTINKNYGDAIDKNSCEKHHEIFK